MVTTLKHHTYLMASFPRQLE